MSERGTHEPTQSPASSTAHIDHVCDEFEKACRTGQPPMIEEFLLRSPPQEHDRLLAELLEIELDCRQRANAFIQVEDYKVRFPEEAELVDSVFRRVVKTRRLADYELLEELGHGGMGVVYKARQVYLNQIVAVKILPRRFLDDAQAVARFRREMQSIGSLGHPNIVRAYNAGEAGGVHFLVMEYVDGIDLQRFVDLGPPDGGPVGVGAACEILRQAALGLQHAYEHQLVHRDIKPANLMLARQGQVKILDMGLAKLQAETRNDAGAQDRLTQPGMTMGTIDYMAPEQWENPASADIRADIYSLGCTLFFLLTGKPPYGEPTYDTSRKKLMAHVVAPIPPLAETCVDVPVELQEIYETMMAKSPQNRYAAPAELAEAMAEFADAEELAEVIAALPAHELCIKSDNTGVHGPAADTPRQHESGSGGSHPRRSRNRWTRRQKFRRNVTVGIAAGLTVVIGGALAWTVIKQHDAPRLTGDLPSTRGTASSRNTGQPPETAAIATPREPLATELALLPGLSGRWWFEETPWLMPFVRQAIAERVLKSPDLTAVLGEHPHGYLQTNTTEARQWLWQAAARCRGDLSPCQQELMDRLKALADDNRAKQGSTARLLADALQQFQAGHRGVLSATDLHSVALLQHAIAVAKHDTALAQEAKKSYDKALKAYAAQPSDDNAKKTNAAQPKSQVAMQPLGLTDSAVLAEFVLDDAKDARQRLKEALDEKNLPVLFRVSALVERGRLAAATAASPGDYEDHYFDDAKKLLDSFDSVKPTHPLAAYIDESYAESLLAQWKVEEAGKQFQAAYHIRLTDKEEKDPSAAIYVYQDRQGSALTNRFRGNLDSARRACRTLADEIQTAIDEAERGRGLAMSASDLAALRAQLVDCLESWADCEFYGGAASNGKVNLAQAADAYDRARKMAADRGDALVLGWKLAIVRTLAGKEKAAQEIVAELRSDRGATAGPNQQRATLARQLAEAVSALKGPSPTDGRKLLRAFLDQFKLHPTAPESHRWEIVEMQLFAAELLLTSDLEGEPRSARKDLAYLDSLLALFQGRREMRPYLRRFYELAVEAGGKSDRDKADFVQTTQYILASRMAQPQSAPGSKATLLVFSFTPKENFAVFLPQDGRPGKRFELDVTRDQIKSAKGKPLHLNDELVDRVRSEIAAHRPVEVFWDDTASRPSGDPDALSDGDWPFGSQLDLPKARPATPPLREKVRGG